MGDVFIWIESGILLAILVCVGSQWYTTNTNKSRFDEIEQGLAMICQGLIEKIDDLRGQAQSSINLVNQNPIASFIDLIRMFKGEEIGTFSPDKLTDPPRSDLGQFVEVDSYATTKEEDNSP